MPHPGRGRGALFDLELPVATIKIEEREGASSTASLYNVAQDHCVIPDVLDGPNPAVEPGQTLLEDRVPRAQDVMADTLEARINQGRSPGEALGEELLVV